MMGLAHNIWLRILVPLSIFCCFCIISGLNNDVDRIEEDIVMAVSICGKAKSPSFGMFKRLLFSIAHNKEPSRRVKIYAIYDDKSSTPESIFCSESSNRATNILKQIELQNIQVEFVPYVTNEFIKMFKLCSTNKLFLSYMIPESESFVISLDADTIFTEDPANLWNYKYNQTVFHRNVVMAGVQETFDNSVDHCHYCKKLSNGDLGNPSYGHYGINAGVILFNMTLFRRIKLDQYFMKILTHKPSFSNFALGDQDVVNQAVKLNPDIFHYLPCRWNRNINRNSCKDAGNGFQTGIIHGNGRGFNVNYWTSRGVSHDLAQTTFLFYSELMKGNGDWCLHDDQDLISLRNFEIDQKKQSTISQKAQPQKPHQVK